MHSKENKITKKCMHPKNSLKFAGVHTLFTI